MKQRVKDRCRRQQAEEQWSLRQERKAERKDQRRWQVKRRVSVVMEEEALLLYRKKKQQDRQVLDGRSGSVTKVRNRCVVSGYGRSVIRWFRKSGRTVREIARRGKLEGVYRVSW